MLLFEITLYSLFREGKKATNETQNLQLNRPEKGGGKKKNRKPDKMIITFNFVIYSFHYLYIISLFISI